ncbi:DUF1707 SHOCT-like domain-containing protein [Microtetraspora niveoalba]|uniref:DUF1707 SHOCT-like domain-containing protein n=1 Tax=Microtetraspora niveoalba TaxID=46175 RepID=UPI000A064355|nr:DUF1707 domain-containing protein [Microtetraspora niveoalba]
MASAEQPPRPQGSQRSRQRSEPAPRDGLRVGDRERDEVTRAVHDAFVQGRITREELDERLDATLAAKTEGDLRRVTADLPGVYGREPGGVHEGPPWAPDRRGHGPWATGTGHRPWTAGDPGVAPSMAGGPWGPGAGLAPWSRRAAEARRGPYGRRRGGPPPIALLIPAALVTVALVSGVAWPLFAAIKVLFFAWIVMAVLGLAHHGRFHRRHRHGGRIRA